MTKVMTDLMTVLYIFLLLAPFSNNPLALWTMAVILNAMSLHSVVNFWLLQNNKCLGEKSNVNNGAFTRSQNFRYLFNFTVLA